MVLSSTRPTQVRSARFTVIGSYLLIALLLLLCPACSTPPSSPPTPALQANLRQDCPPLPLPPKILIDPDRALWEASLIAFYGDCAGRHHRTVEAWPTEHE